MHMKGEPMVGKEKWAKEKELCLSDAYIVKDNEPSLELKVKVINIRPEEHHEILEKCQVLKEYSQFMEIVQNYQISGVEEPYKKAIKECIEKGILADYLMRKISKWSRRRKSSKNLFSHSKKARKRKNNFRNCR